MNLQVLYLIVTVFSSVSSTPWSRNIGCPAACTCREEHFSDLPIARYTRLEPNHVESLSTDYQISNDVLYEEEMNFDEENPLLRVATCFLQAETNIEEFISTLPTTIEALSIVKSSDSGNKTILTSYFVEFNELIALELQGSESIDPQSVNNELVVEIDTPIHSLKYLNFDKVHIKNSKLREIPLPTEENDEEIEIKFESVAMIQKKEQESEILPYYKYKEIQKNLESPLLTGFGNLILARICSCNLQNIHWEMFDGLQSLKYLVLENNNLKFIPSFAFYGTPNLKFLSLAWNNLLNIQIRDLAGLLELEHLDLSHNNFSQLSELSFPPFPKLKVADFRDNPITIVFPNTFDIMNTTDSIILGGEEIRLQLQPNSFLGLSKLLKLTLNNVDVVVLKQEFFTGMPVLKELVLSGTINKIEFDAFLEVRQLEKLILSNCNLHNISMDSFYGLQNLILLDLSKNHLKYLPPNIFDDQIQLKELLLNGNEFRELPKGIFDKVPAKLIRLNENPWHCSCAMSDWNPMVINKVKQRVFTSCDAQHDKGIGCTYEKKYAYSYENRVAPKCTTPNKLKNQSVFQAIRRQLLCRKNKLKLKSYKNTTDFTKKATILPVHINTNAMKTNIDTVQQLQNVMIENEMINLKNIKIQDNREPNDLIANYHMKASPDFYFQELNTKTDKVTLNKKKKQMHTLMKLKKLNKMRNLQHKEM